MTTSGTGAEAATAAGPGQVVKVKRKLLVACMTCPICHKLLRDATTISECLHTFCRKCIYDKLNEEEADFCPVCNIHLGFLPVEKLRADHNLQDLRAKIFPFKKTKAGAPDPSPSITLPVRRKEISLSSLVVNTPRIAAQTGLTGRRRKAVGSRAATSHGRSPATNESNINEDNDIDKLAKKSSSNGNPSRLSLSRRQASLGADISSNTAKKDVENGGKPLQDKAELWKPLNCLVEAANRTKTSRSSMQNLVTKAEQRHVPDNKVNINKTRVEEHPCKSEVKDEKNDSDQLLPVTVKAKRLQGVSKKRRNLKSSVQILPDAANAQSDRRMITPLWFCLVATFDQTGDSSLPQISTSYLRIKDGNVPVSYIQKYLVTKLNLVSEAEVEITCHGEPVKPTLSLHNLVEQWVRRGSSQKLQAVIGTSAKEFVVVLGYRRRRVPA
ncbi:E3 ubiquitin protein ligase [Musa troglodytarum]|uniref:E3 ubiquitin protein ligase n=1 Tax=Musa troglodytarum TaxID=320322 RepID=A0A9E7FVQ0_9LILI|nr:E3 ubiquitin protein ligase [Musa troglodytarum]